ncbi:MAG: hypothetical protein WA581_09095 [Candidatus Acidiferrales bacterium]
MQPIRALAPLNNSQVDNELSSIVPARDRVPFGTDAAALGINLVTIKGKQAAEMIAAVFAGDVRFDRLRAIVVKIDNRGTGWYRLGAQNSSAHGAQLEALASLRRRGPKRKAQRARQQKAGECRPTYHKTTVWGSDTACLVRSPHGASAGNQPTHRSTLPGMIQLPELLT